MRAPRHSIFISYRREDEREMALLLYKELTAEFGEGAVFMDVYDIGLGEEFPDTIRRALDSCLAGVIVIGPRWDGSNGVENPERLSRVADHVRIECEALLRSGRTLKIPCYVGGVESLERFMLPGTLESLIRISGRVVRGGADFESDVGAIIRRIERRLREEPGWFQRNWKLGWGSATIGGMVAVSLATLVYMQGIQIKGFVSNDKRFESLTADIGNARTELHGIQADNQQKVADLETRLARAESRKDSLELFGFPEGGFRFQSPFEYQSFQTALWGAPKKVFVGLPSLGAFSFPIVTPQWTKERNSEFIKDIFRQRTEGVLWDRLSLGVAGEEFSLVVPPPPVGGYDFVIPTIRPLF